MKAVQTEFSTTKKMFHSPSRNAALHLSSYRITEHVSVKAQLHVGLSESEVYKCMTGSSVPAGVGLLLGFKLLGCHSPDWVHSLDARAPLLQECWGSALKLYVGFEFQS